MLCWTELPTTVPPWYTRSNKELTATELAERLLLAVDWPRKVPAKACCDGLETSGVPPGRSDSAVVAWSRTSTVCEAGTELVTLTALELAGCKRSNELIGTLPFGGAVTVWAGGTVVEPPPPPHAAKAAAPSNAASASPLRAEKDVFTDTPPQKRERDRPRKAGERTHKCLRPCLRN